MLIKKETLPQEGADASCGHATNERVAPFVAPFWALFPPVDDAGDGAGNMHIVMTTHDSLKIPTLVNKRVLNDGDSLVWAEKGEPYKPEAIAQRAEHASQLKRQKLRR